MRAAVDVACDGRGVRCAGCERGYACAELRGAMDVWWFRLPRARATAGLRLAGWQRHVLVMIRPWQLFRSVPDPQEAATRGCGERSRRFGAHRRAAAPSSPTALARCDGGGGILGRGHAARCSPRSDGALVPPGRLLIGDAANAICPGRGGVGSSPPSRTPWRRTGNSPGPLRRGEVTSGRPEHVCRYDAGRHDRSSPSRAAPCLTGLSSSRSSRGARAATAAGDPHKPSPLTRRLQAVPGVQAIPAYSSRSGPAGSTPRSFDALAAL